MRHAKEDALLYCTVHNQRVYVDDACTHHQHRSPTLYRTKTCVNCRHSVHNTQSKRDAALITAGCSELTQIIEDERALQDE